jgi:hypothetical protein
MAQPESSILKVVDAAGEPVGVAFVIGPAVAATAAHVVNEALGRDLRDARKPPAAVCVALAFAEGPHAEATVSAWHPPGRGDIGLLSLAGSPLAGLRPLRLAAGVVGTITLDVCGFPPGLDAAVWAEARVVGKRGDGRIQVQALSQEGYRIQPGFSGAPAIDRATAEVVGMVVETEREHGARVAFLAPADALAGPAADPRSRLAEGVVRGRERFEDFIAEYLGTAEREAPFVGRRAAVDALDAWLLDGSSQHALVVEGPGRGKSALAAQWTTRLAARPDVSIAFMPISIRFGTADRSTALSLLGQRLRHLAGARWDAPATPEGWALEIERLLRDGTPDTLLVVVADGIDEAVGWRFEEHLRLIGLGRGVKVLVLARAMADRGPAGWRRALGWPDEVFELPLPTLDRAAIAESLPDGARGQAADGVDGQTAVVVNELMRLTGGEPFLVGLYLDALGAGGGPGAYLSIEDLASLDPGTRALFARWWREQEQQWRQQGRDPLRETEHVQHFLTACAVALGPISRDQLAALAGDLLPSGFALARVAEDVGRFIIGDGVRTGYVLAHPRLREFFRDEAGDQLAAVWEERFVGYCTGVADAIRGGDLTTAPEYVVRHLGAHLVAARADAAAFYGLNDPSWLMAWERLDPTYDGFKDDLTLAWRAAERTGDWIEQLWCALLMSTLAAAVDAVPPALLRELVRREVWSVPDAVAYAKRVPSIAGSVKALSALAETLSPEQAADAVRASRPGWVRLRAELLVALAADLEPGDRMNAASEIARDAESAGDESLRLLVHALVAPYRPAATGAIRDAVRKLGGIRDPASRAFAVTILAPHLDREEVAIALASARTVMSVGPRSAALAALALVADGRERENAVREAAAAASTVGDPVLRLETLATLPAAVVALAAHRPFEHELAAVEVVARPADRARARLALYRYAAAWHDPVVVDLGPCQGEIAAVEDARDRVELLTQRSATAPPDLAGALVEEALALSRRVGDQARGDATILALAAEMSRVPPAAHDVLQRPSAPVSEAAVAVLATLGAGGDRGASARAGRVLLQLDGPAQAQAARTLRDRLGVEPLAAIRRAANPGPHLAGLEVALAPVMPDVVWSAADGPSHSEVLREAAPVLSAADRASFVRALLALDDMLLQAGSLIDVADGQEDVLEDALDACDRVLDLDARCGLLLRVVGSSRGAVSRTAAARAAKLLTQLDSADAIADAIAVLAPVLGRDATPLPAVAATLRPDALKVRALVALGNVAAARALAERASAAYSGAVAWTALGGSYDDAWPRATRAATLVDDEAARCAAVEAMAPDVPDRHLAALAGAAGAMRQSALRSRALGALVPRFVRLRDAELAPMFHQLLRGLSSRGRPAFLADLQVLVPVLRVLGGEQALGAATERVASIVEMFP